MWLSKSVASPGLRWERDADSTPSRPRTAGTSFPRYYVFDGTYIVAGFDNHADLSAIRLRYGAEWKQHRYEPISHLHLENKTKLELTEEMTCQQFLTWMELNLRLAPT